MLSTTAPELALQEQLWHDDLLRVLKLSPRAAAYFTNMDSPNFDFNRALDNEANTIYGKAIPLFPLLVQQSFVPVSSVLPAAGAVATEHESNLSAALSLPVHLTEAQSMAMLRPVRDWLYANLLALYNNAFNADGEPKLWLKMAMQAYLSSLTVPGTETPKFTDFSAYWDSPVFKRSLFAMLSVASHEYAMAREQRKPTKGIVPSQSQQLLGVADALRHRLLGGILTAERLSQDLLQKVSNLDSMQTAIQAAVMTHLALSDEARASDTTLIELLNQLCINKTIDSFVYDSFWEAVNEIAELPEAEKASAAAQAVSKLLHKTQVFEFGWETLQNDFQARYDKFIKRFSGHVYIQLHERLFSVAEAMMASRDHQLKGYQTEVAAIAIITTLQVNLEKAKTAADGSRDIAKLMEWLLINKIGSFASQYDGIATVRTERSRQQIVDVADNIIAFAAALPQTHQTIAALLKLSTFKQTAYQQKLSVIQQVEDEPYVVSSAWQHYETEQQGHIFSLLLEPVIDVAELQRLQKLYQQRLTWQQLFSSSSAELQHMADSIDYQLATLGHIERLAAYEQANAAMAELTEGQAKITALLKLQLHWARRSHSTAVQQQQAVADILLAFVRAKQFVGTAQEQYAQRLATFMQLVLACELPAEWEADLRLLASTGLSQTLLLDSSANPAIKSLQLDNYNYVLLHQPQKSVVAMSSVIFRVVQQAIEQHLRNVPDWGSLRLETTVSYLPALPENGELPVGSNFQAHYRIDAVRSTTGHLYRLQADLQFTLQLTALGLQIQGMAIDAPVADKALLSHLLLSDRLNPEAITAFINAGGFCGLYPAALIDQLKTCEFYARGEGNILVRGIQGISTEYDRRQLLKDLNEFMLSRVIKKILEIDDPEACSRALELMMVALLSLKQLRPDPINQLLMLVNPLGQIELTYAMVITVCQLLAERPYGKVQASIDSIYKMINKAPHFTQYDVLCQLLAVIVHTQAQPALIRKVMMLAESRKPKNLEASVKVILKEAIAAVLNPANNLDDKLAQLELTLKKLELEKHGPSLVIHQPGTQQHRTSMLSPIAGVISPGSLFSPATTTTIRQHSAPVEGLAAGRERSRARGGSMILSPSTSLGTGTTLSDPEREEGSEAPSALSVAGGSPGVP